MGSSFGKFFTISTWGESHGGSVGVVIDGCPPNLPLSVAEIQAAQQAIFEDDATRRHLCAKLGRAGAFAEADRLGVRLGRRRDDAPDARPVRGAQAHDAGCARCEQRDAAGPAETRTGHCAAGPPET